jgi:riboflavin kinase/FMN adenylyltransferase
MIVLSNHDSLPEELRPSVVTIGKFDGVHCGHRALIDRARELASASGRSTVVVTFDRHPAVLFAPERAPRPLVSLVQKEELLEEVGIDAVVVVQFTREFSQLTPEQFVDFLVDELGMEAIVLGSDFRFGHRGAGDVEFLRTRGARDGFDTVVVPETSDGTDHRASSSRIRMLLDHGNVRAVTAALDRHHVIRGEVVHGAKRGRELGFPTADLGPETVEGYVPADGVYAGWMLVDGERLPAAISVGNNPTFEGVPQKQIEAYVLDRSFDLYGKTVSLELVDFIRSMERFDSLPALVAELHLDVERTRELLAAE